MKTELEIQQWLQATIAADKLVPTIGGRGKIRDILRQQHSPEFWPDFPIDYLTRLRVLETADGMIDHLHDLVPVSASDRSISRTKGEALFVDLLYARPEGSKFVAFEIKKDKGTAREAITELLAYEHEIQNHVPFASSRDVLLVIVSREFPALLDHAVCGLVTWGRRRILCLRFDDQGGEPTLSIHTPSPWAAVGQTVLPPDGLQTAHLTVRLNSKLSSEETLAIFETAAQLMVREAERAGGSGFVFVAEHIFFPGLSQSEYVLVAGALNPYCFLQQAERFLFADESDSPLSAFLLKAENREDLTIGWDWIGTDGDAAVTYLEQFGSVSWEGTSNWATFRDPRRWRSKSVRPDRYLYPVTSDSWGVLGDFLRDAIRHHERLKNFAPGYCKPGIDWRYPRFTAQFLDDLAISPVVDSGRWSFTALFEFGLRLGRHAAYAAQFADADETDRRKLRPALFWAEVDLLRLIEEVRQRYQAAVHLHANPPVFMIGLYESGTQVMEQSTAFSKWMVEQFIGPKEVVLQSAFVTGLKVYALYDLSFGNFEGMASLRQRASSTARDWLTLTIEEMFTGGISQRSVDRLHSLSSETFGAELMLDGTRESALRAVSALNETKLVDALAYGIPEMVDCWCPQLGHVLLPIIGSLDWDWCEQQIREHHRRGVKNPCIVVSAGGQFGIGVIPPGLMPLPQIADAETEVLVLLDQSLARLAIPMKWSDLRAGKIPGMCKPI